MTSDRKPEGRRPDDQTPEVLRARAEFAAALTELDDRLNVPKRLRRLRAESPVKLMTAAAGASVALAGVIALGVLAAIRRR